MIDVIATQAGVYGKWRDPGDKFMLAKKAHFSKKWMKPADDKSAQMLEVKPPKPKAEPEDELEVMDDDALIEYADLNCPGLTLSRTMKDATMRDRIRAYRPTE